MEFINSKSPKTYLDIKLWTFLQTNINDAIVNTQTAE